jgi:membrane protein DedA with SNARE-associated domain
VVYLTLLFIVFALNCLPAFTPPTWTVLTGFVLVYHLPVLPVVFIGVLGATAGRSVLYLLTLYLGERLLRGKTKENFTSLGSYFNSKKHLSLLLFLTYAFIPLPSNQLFITAGLARVNLIMLSLAFAFGRLVSYSWTVYSSRFVLERIQVQISPTETIITQILGLLVIFLISKVDWKKILKQS